MTPKEKATELISKMYNHFEDDDAIAYSTAKHCALIAVDEILNIEWDEFEMSGNEVMYWQEVKQEIEKL